MRQILGGRKHNNALAEWRGEVLQVSGDQPAARGMGQGEERQVFGGWPCIRPRFRLRQAQAAFDQKLQPKRRKSVAAKLGPLNNFLIFLNNSGSGDDLYLPLQYPIRDQHGRCPTRRNARGDNHAGIENDQFHFTVMS